MVIAGGNGFLGRLLARYFREKGWEVSALVRDPAGDFERVKGVRYMGWDGGTLGDWVEVLEGAELVVNLAGRTVNCRYGRKHREEILRSRVESTRALGEAVAACGKPPRLWINSSTATIYRHAEDGPQDERTGEIGKGFSVEVAQAWERAFFQASVPGAVRKVALRTSMVVAREKGTVFDYLFTLSRWGLGGRMGSGRQRVSWVSGTDFCRVVAWCVENEGAEGIYNVVAPGVVTNAEWMAAFRRVAGRGWGLPATRWMLELGAFLLRTETELILKSRWVEARRLREEGFVFHDPELERVLEGRAIRENQFPESD